LPRWRRRKRSKSGPAQQSALQPSVEQEQVRVSVGVNMFVAASTDASDEA
jgi:hypothetical protein